MVCNGLVDGKYFIHVRNQVFVTSLASHWVRVICTLPWKTCHLSMVWRPFQYGWVLFLFCRKRYYSFGFLFAWRTRIVFVGMTTLLLFCWCWIFFSMRFYFILYFFSKLVPTFVGTGENLEFLWNDATSVVCLTIKNEQDIYSMKLDA